ncbi:HAD family hydrolase [Actinomadura sp. 3N508]|uniref:HAD family hydrolase n=1 Tax=Actinomadura sp. 3N508 TaxID=3375153 RepID=UPI0037A5155C
MTPAILLGLTGVLVDDEDLHRRAFYESATDAGLRVTAHDYRTFFTGRTAREGIRALLAQRAPGRLPDLDDLLAAKTRAYCALAETGLNPYPGAIDLVLTLARSRHRLALVTGSTTREVAATLRVLRLDDAFDAIVTAETVPEGDVRGTRYLAAARLLNRPPGQCVIMERATARLDLKYG